MHVFDQNPYPIATAETRTVIPTSQTVTVVRPTW